MAEAVLSTESPTCPTCKDRYVYLDQGGELYANPNVKNVFANWHHVIYLLRIQFIWSPVRFLW